MPRVTPRRGRKEDPYPGTPLPPPLDARPPLVRVVKEFSYAGAVFKAGTVMRLDEPLVQELAREYPADEVARFLRLVRNPT